MEEIENLQQDGKWIQGYIGNKIVENLSSMDTEDDGDQSLSPLKE